MGNRFWNIVERLSGSSEITHDICEEVAEVYHLIPRTEDFLLTPGWIESYFRKLSNTHIMRTLRNRSAFTFTVDRVDESAFLLEFIRGRRTQSLNMRYMDTHKVFHPLFQLNHLPSVELFVVLFETAVKHASIEK